MKNSANYLMHGNNYKDTEAGQRPALQIAEHALSSPDREVCGFVYKDRYIPLTNVSEDPNSFYADPTEVAQTLLRYGEPVAIFHTHPNGRWQPSSKDLQLASYYSNSIIIIGRIENSGLEIYVVAPPQPDPAPAVQP
jgi:proteasome lid subunit RPN8/RPN11